MQVNNTIVDEILEVQEALTMLRLKGKLTPTYKDVAEWLYDARTYVGDISQMAGETAAEYAGRINDVRDRKIAALRGTVAHLGNVYNVRRQSEIVLCVVEIRPYLNGYCCIFSFCE